MAIPSIPTTTRRSKRLGLLPLLLGGLALWQWYARHCEREQQRSRQATPNKSKPAEVTTWEGEGGALHGTGAQLGPDPAGGRAS